MLRFIVRETDVAYVVYAGGRPQTRLVSFDGDHEALERFLRLWEEGHD